MINASIFESILKNDRKTERKDSKLLLNYLGSLLVSRAATVNKKKDGPQYDFQGTHLSTAVRSKTRSTLN